MIQNKFNQQPVDHQTENLLNVQLHNFPNLMKNVTDNSVNSRYLSDDLTAIPHSPSMFYHY